MILMRASIFAITLAVLSFSKSASAITYRLFDHGYGNLGPDYGLRVDSISSVGIGNSSSVFATADTKRSYK